MNLQQLRVFRESARLGGFTRASTELRLSQSTISLHIKKLEEELGTPLFVRTKRHIFLNDAGRLLLEHTERIFREIKEAEAAVRELNDLQHGVIHLGSGATTIVYLLPRVLGAFQRRHPLVELIVTTGSSEMLIQAVHQLELDLAIVMTPVPSSLAVEVLPFLHEELVFVVAPSHPLSQHKEVRPSDMTDVPFISFLRDSAMQNVIDKQFSAAGFVPCVTMEMENIEAIKSLVRAGLGAAILPACAVSGSHGAMLHTFRMKNFRFERELALAIPRGVAPPRVIQRFANLITRALTAHNIPQLRTNVVGRKAGQGASGRSA